MNERYIAERITELRLSQNVSEYQMSLELGLSKSYIQGITSGKNLPSVKQLFNIADYFNVSLSEFFSEKNPDPPAVREAVNAIRHLSERDARLILELICGLYLQRQMTRQTLSASKNPAHACGVGRVLVYRGSSKGPVPG